MSHIYKVILHLLQSWIVIFWMQPHNVTSTNVAPDLDSWLKLLVMNECKRCHCALVETVRPFKLHPTSISYICKVYDHLLQLWMGM